MGEAYLINHKRKEDKGLVYYDRVTSIGANQTMEGAAYNESGFFGTVPSNLLFTGSELASAVGITQGTLQYDTTEWLKFYIDGKIIFRPMKAFRHSIPWTALNTAGVIDGSKTVTKNGVTFRVRLMRGALTDTINTSDADRGAKGSEWNRTILPIHINSSNGAWATNAYVDDITYNLNYTDEDLLTSPNYGNGYSVWCQESQDGSPTRKVYRGGGNATVGGAYIITTNAQTIATVAVGWCPVLEVV